MNLFEEIQEVEQEIVRVKNNQDQILDMYNPNNPEMNNLLKELVALHSQYETLLNDFLVLSTNAE